MGRAVLIICAGVLVTLGYVGLGALQQGRQVTVNNVSYLDKLRAKNAAQTAIQMAMAEINNDDTWKDDKTEDNPWINNIDNSEVHLYVETIYEETDSDKFYEPDTIKVVSTASYYDSVSEEQSNARVIGVYVTSAIGEFVQNFKGAVTITAQNIKISSDERGTTTVSGTDTTGQCLDKPSFSMSNDELVSKVSDYGSPFYLEGDVKRDQTSNYNPTQDLITRLETQDGVTFIKNDYSGNLGTKVDPGVFFVDNSATIGADIDQGYGILIIRSGGSITMEDSSGNVIPTGENFIFNGLSIFENAYELDIQKAPSVNGSIIIGETADKLQDIKFILKGNIHFQYNCTSEVYAKQAAAELLPFTRYRRISTFE